MEFPSLIQDFAELVLHPMDERSKWHHGRSVMIGDKFNSSFYLTYKILFGTKISRVGRIPIPTPRLSTRKAVSLLPVPPSPMSNGLVPVVRLASEGTDAIVSFWLRRLPREPCHYPVGKSKSVVTATMPWLILIISFVSRLWDMSCTEIIRPIAFLYCMWSSLTTSLDFPNFLMVGPNGKIWFAMVQE